LIVIVKELYPCSSKLQQNHTRRCKHASDENDEEYIRRALQLGANEIRGYKEKAEYMKKLNEFRSLTALAK
jgi:hypothetical protein